MCADRCQDNNGLVYDTDQHCDNIKTLISQKRYSDAMNQLRTLTDRVKQLQIASPDIIPANPRSLSDSLNEL